MKIPATLLVLSAPVLALEPDASAERLSAGPLVMDVHVAFTPLLFHAVDQISAWSPHCHPQYLAAFEPLDGEDREWLARHREIRGRHGWGQGLEQTFYVGAELEEALEQGIAAGWLTAEEADLEAEILLHFAERAERLFDAERPRLEAFRGRIRGDLESLGEFAVRLERLVGGRPEPVPVFLLANPAERDKGGGFNGGKLTLEIPRSADAYGTFLHEVFHAFLDPEKERMQAFLRGGWPGLDFSTLNEGLAHAVSPGLFPAPTAEHDDLAERVKRFEDQGDRLNSYRLRVHRYGLALRPLVARALKSDSMEFEELLVRAAEIWEALVELEAIRPVRGDPRTK